MATSLLFQINKFLIVEYLYSSGVSAIVRPSNVTSFRKIANAYTGLNTYVNDNNSKLITRNVIDWTTVDLGNGRLALMDNDSAYFYPNSDPNIVVSNVAISPTLNVMYDKIRLHILSGYNFEDLEGGNLSIYVRMNNDKQFRLCDLSLLKTDVDRIFFNPRPLKLSDFVYDKFLEFEIPSQSDMLDDQEATPGSTTTLAYYLSGGIGIANQYTIYCEYHDIREVVQEDGLIYFEPGEAVRFAFNSRDVFSGLTANIVQSTDGDYFEYSAQWNGDSIEDFIFQLNSVAKNNYFLIHELRVLEQVNNTFIETDNVSSIQNSGYDEIKRWRPILRHSATATSFSIEYTVRLYNSVDGRSIFKTSTVTSMDVNKYGPLVTSLNVGNVHQPLKVYNQIKGDRQINVVDNLVELTTTKILATYVDNNDIQVRSDSDLDRSIDGLVIKVNPFDNFYKFNLLTPTGDGEYKMLELSPISTYKMVFIKDDGSGMYIDEFTSQSFQKQEGELAFRVTKNQSLEIKTFIDKNFYIINKNPDGIETVIFSGKWITD